MRRLVLLLCVLFLFSCTHSIHRLSYVVHPELASALSMRGTKESEISISTATAVTPVQLDASSMKRLQKTYPGLPPNYWQFNEYTTLIKNDGHKNSRLMFGVVDGWIMTTRFYDEMRLEYGVLVLKPGESRVIRFLSDGSPAENLVGLVITKGVGMSLPDTEMSMIASIVVYLPPKRGVVLDKKLRVIKK